MNIKQEAASGFTQRFWTKVAVSGHDDCWEWQGFRDRWGYGTFRAGPSASKRGAHRASFEIHHGPIPPDLIIRHTCDNPACVNPHHLLLGTHKSNAEDRSARGRTRVGIGSRQHLSKLQETDIPVIRKALRDGELPGTIASRYGVSGNTIRCIHRGVTWRHVQKKPAPRSP